MCKNLKLENLQAGFNGQSLFGSLSGEFSCGQINLVVGRAGIGKSTLLKTIAGFHRPLAGRILLGEDEFVAHGSVSLAFQNPENLFFNTTVMEEAAYAVKMQKRDQSNTDEIVSNWLEKWGLSAHIYGARHPLELSGGEKRRLALAACTICAPPVILLDEPLAGIDHTGQKILSAVIKELAVKHIVIVVTHEPENFINDSRVVLFLQQNDAGWFDANSFLRTALGDHDFFPLPDWYFRHVRPFASADFLPAIDPHSVFAFLSSQEACSAD